MYYFLLYVWFVIMLSLYSGVDHLE